MGTMSQSNQQTLYGKLPIKLLLNILDAQTTKILVFISLLVFIVELTLIVVRPPSAYIGQIGNWWTIALNLTHRQGYALCNHSYFPFCGPDNQITASSEPAPVFLFAGIALLTRDSLVAASFAEVFLYILVMWGVFALTKEWATPRAALLAAVLWAIYPPALRLIPLFSGDLMATVGVTLGMVFLLRARKTDRTWDWLATGIGLGVGVMSRSAVLVVVATVMLGLILERLQGWKNSRNWLRPVLLVSLFVAAMMIPWMVRNEIVLGKPVLGSTLTGYNIYRHNYMLGSTNYFRYVGGEEGLQAVNALLARRPDLLGTENEAQMDAIYRQEGLKIIRAHPAQYGLLSAFRFFPLWFNWQVNEAYGARTTRSDYAIMLFQALLLILSALGIRGKTWRTWPLWASVVATSLAYMTIVSQLRYLVPVMPLVISLGAAGGLRLLGKVAPAWAK
jgi:hypothetical protein